MLKKERQVQILDILDEKTFVKVEELSDALGVSEVTIRRDISELSQENKLIKVHGGAQKKRRKIKDTDLSLRNEQNIKEKKKIAEKAAALLEPGQTVYLDAGSTCAVLIPYLEGKDLRVYTHGVHHLDALLHHNIETYLIGGKLKATTLAVVGSLSQRYLEDMSFDLAFIAFNAYHDDFGYSTPDESEAMMKAAVIRQSKQVYFLGDQSKFGQRAGVHFAHAKDGILISD